jgi:hypothetical protein
VLGSRHPETLTSLNNMAFLYNAQGRYGEAEPLYQEALQARRELLGSRYQRLRKDEPADVWVGADASKARLMALKSPPRVLLSFGLQY